MLCRQYKNAYSLYFVKYEDKWLKSSDIIVILQTYIQKIRYSRDRYCHRRFR